MKAVIVVVPYIANDKHAKDASETFNSIEFVYDKEIISVINKCEPRYQNLLDHWTDIEIDNNKNNLAKAWNLGILEAKRLKYKYIFIPNLDVILQPKLIENCVDFLENEKGFDFVSPTNSRNYEAFEKFRPVNSYEEKLNGDSFSGFMIRSSLVDKIGYFDEGFEPAYFEDNDFSYRMRLAGIKYATLHSTMFFHKGSGTINNDNSLQSSFPPFFEKNKQRFVQKWGGLPDCEQYKTPYNQ